MHKLPGTHTISQKSIRWFLIAIVSIVVLASVVAFLLIPRSGNFLMDNGTNISVIGDSTLKVHEVFDFGIEFGNISQNQVITMHMATFSKGLPAHISLLHEAIMIPSDQPPGQTTSIIGARGWPPGSADGQSSVIHPLDGYSLAPNTPATVILALVADAPGTYVIGPVTIHAKAPGIFGSDIGTVSTEMTYTQYAVMCPQISRATCQKVEKSVSKAQ